MNITHAGIFEVKTHLSDFISRVENGDTFVITKRGKPVAELRPPANPTISRPKRGHLKGQLLYMAPDFDAPLEDLKDYTE